MGNTARHPSASIAKIHDCLDRALFGFSAFAVPAIVCLVSIAAFFLWHSHYPDDSGIPVQFRILSDQSGILTPAQATAKLKGLPAQSKFETKLNEAPFWFAFEAPASSREEPLAIEFPSRHAFNIQCWSANEQRELGYTDRRQSRGAIKSAKAGFALALPESVKPLPVVCKSQYVGPARIVLEQWSALALENSARVFHHNSGLLDGGLLILSGFMLVTAIINRKSLYIVFAAWLFVSLRVGALSAGWDFQWLGKTIPPEWLPLSRLLTITLDYVLTLTLFRSLFDEELKVIGYTGVLRACQWISLALLPAAVIAPYAAFLPVFWVATIGLTAALAFLLVRILLITRSSAAIWYSASLAITLSSNTYEVIAAAFGIVGNVNSITAALSSSLLASLALASQMRADHVKRLEAQAALRQNYEAIPIGLFSLNTQGRFLNANPALMKMLGTDVLRDTRNTWVQHFGRTAWRQLLEQVHAVKEVELEIHHATPFSAGEKRNFLVRAALSSDKIEGWIQDVTEKEKAVENLRFLAIHDSLTKTYNRRGIEGAYNTAMMQMESDTSLSVAYLDLARFKLINDMYGHTAGDEVLKQVCDRIRGMLAGTQSIGRMGGDEFFIVMPLTPISSARWILRGISQAICNKEYRFGGKAFQVGVSIGVVEISQGTLFKDAMANAERACRQARANQNDGMVVYERDSKALSEHAAELNLVERLADGSALKGLYLEMQPIMSLKTPSDTHNFEVLLRMRQPNGKIVPASRIMAAAENSGMTDTIDRWVLSTTLAWINENLTRLPRTRFVCMNLSGASLNDERFIQDAYAMLAENGRAARMLCIEITESVALSDLQNTRRFIEKVRSYDAKVALDDFGAGYTSFTYLKELPADVLKIDGSFIVDMTHHPTNVSIVETIQGLASNLGMKTIAEWAEDAATVRALAQAGVDYVQGFAIARPQLPENILATSSSADFVRDERLQGWIRSIDEEYSSNRQHDLLAPLYFTTFK